MYSEIHEYDGRKFRYNYTDNLLEWVFIEDETLEVVEVQGLSEDNWEEDKEYWIEIMGYNIDEMLMHMEI